MKSAFSMLLSQLRREKGFSQRQAASDLGVSQALLSHYENGAREPKIEFIIRVSDYYNVSTDFILGRSSDRGGEAERLAEAVRDISCKLEDICLKSTRLTVELKGLAPNRNDAL